MPCKQEAEGYVCYCCPDQWRSRAFDVYQLQLIRGRSGTYCPAFCVLVVRSRCGYRDDRSLLVVLLSTDDR